MATCSTLAGLEATAHVRCITPAQEGPLALTCPQGTPLGFAFLENSCPSVAVSPPWAGWHKLGCAREASLPMRPQLSAALEAAPLAREGLDHGREEPHKATAPECPGLGKRSN